MRVELKMHQILVGPVFKKLSWGVSFPPELEEAKVTDFLTLKQDSLSANEYGLKFT